MPLMHRFHDRCALDRCDNSQVEGTPHSGDGLASWLLSAHGSTRAADAGSTEMELHEIRHFLALSQKLNFTKAAEASYVTRPALMRAMRKMENELGGVFF
jgi:hypothetical protein